MEQIDPALKYLPALPPATDNYCSPLGCSNLLVTIQKFPRARLLRGHPLPWLLSKRRRRRQPTPPILNPIAGSSDNEITVEEASFVHAEPPQDGTAPPEATSDMEVLHEKLINLVSYTIGGRMHTYFDCTTEHGFKDHYINSRILGKNSIQLNWFLEKGKARSDMTVEERIAAADRRKIEGNEYFKEKKFEEAMQQYEMAIAYMGDDFMFQLFGKYRDMALAVKNPCHLNMAACLIKLKRFNEAIAQCSIVLSEDESNVKALFRRGKAKSELGQTESAREDFLKAKKYSPKDKEILRELRLLAEQDKALYQKQKELYKGLFGPRPEVKPKKENYLILIWQWLLSLISYLVKLFKRKHE
ncbi:hypothetical protein PR202_gn00900 [Eleusine coracana subsp. coracana]|uniref:Peptidylprolyl isomerase n=1 Tax=Eleusine coracana subsp. coracana TaxID=191504 RepID=A0AAV5G3V3_ELECO|nr:hypothetical protein PR202_gn00900 [Eleusine coracana subsp. coracana]